MEASKRGLVVVGADVVVADWGRTHGAGLLPFWGIMLSLMVSDNSVEECEDREDDVGGKLVCCG